MKPPKELVIECPVCEEETDHQILGGRVEGKKRIVLRSSVRCCECGHVHSVEIVEERPIDVPIIISWMGKSTRTKIGLLPSDEIRVNDEIFVNEDRTIVTSLESSGVRKRAAKASDITNIWAKKFDKVWVKISLEFHGKVYSKKILAIPEEEFEIGELFDLEGSTAAVTSIKVEGRTIKKGSAMAKDIVRLYARGVRK
ncbi:MAG: HVO_0476 family zinc finger protein [Thermoplasmata archaeon]|nr:HVO_0476 family zinc finger protein [Thermoplasmata archaeon]